MNIIKFHFGVGLSLLLEEIRQPESEFADVRFRVVDVLRKIASAENTHIHEQYYLVVFMGNSANVHQLSPHKLLIFGE